MERTADCNKVREDVVRLIYLYLGKHEIFSAFHCYENKSPPACLEAILLIYSMICVKICNMWGAFLDKISFGTEISCVPRENKGGSETAFRLIWSEKKIDSPRKQYTNFCSYVTMLLLTGNFGKAYKVGNLFCLDDQWNSRHFLQTWSLAHSQNSRMLSTFLRSEMRLKWFP